MSSKRHRKHSKHNIDSSPASSSSITNTYNSDVPRTASKSKVKQESEELEIQHLPTDLPDKNVKKEKIMDNDQDALISEHKNVTTKGQQGFCTKCQKMKRIYAERTCRKCYKQIRAQWDDPSKHRECKECKQSKPIHGHQMCITCYDRVFQTPKHLRTDRHRECQSCHKVKYIYTHEMCSACSWRMRKTDVNNYKNCAECGNLKFIHGRGMCDTCYDRIFREPSKKAKRELLKAKNGNC